MSSCGTARRNPCVACKCWPHRASIARPFVVKPPPRRATLSLPPFETDRLGRLRLAGMIATMYGGWVILSFLCNNQECLLHLRLSSTHSVDAASTRGAPGVCGRLSQNVMISSSCPLNMSSKKIANSVYITKDDKGRTPTIENVWRNAISASVAVSICVHNNGQSHVLCDRCVSGHRCPLHPRSRLIRAGWIKAPCRLCPGGCVPRAPATFPA